MFAVFRGDGEIIALFICGTLLSEAKLIRGPEESWLTDWLSVHTQCLVLLLDED